MFMVCMLGCFSAVAFISALFPKWDIRWKGQKKVPMSVRGRISFGFYAAYLEFCMVAGTRWPKYWNALIVSGLLAIFLMSLAYRRDRLDWENRCH
jgi:hypothetical protein